MPLDQLPMMQNGAADLVALKPFVFVLGVPSGGTSCVAHALRILGIDMGSIPQGVAPHGRNYSTCEDRQFFQLVVNRFAPWGRPIPTSMPDRAAQAVREYVATRRNEAGGASVLGCKGWVNWPALHAAFWEIPNLFVVRIKRPLEHCLSSFLRYQQLAPQNRPIDMIRLAAYVSSLWTMAHHLIEPRPQILDVDYDKFCQVPTTEVERIAHWLGLAPSADQLRQAIAHVRRSS